MTNYSTSLRGWTISLLLHGVALAWLAHRAPPLRLDDTPDRSSTAIFVTLQPKPAARPPEPRIEPRIEPKLPSAAPAASARAAAKASRPAPRQLITSTAPAAEETAQPAGPAEAPAAAPGFDIEAARATARAVAREQGGAAAGGTALKETREEKLGRAIERSRRGDCKTQYAGLGVLAIIPLVKDTVTDSGCKW